MTLSRVLFTYMPRLEPHASCCQRNRQSTICAPDPRYNITCYPKSFGEQFRERQVVPNK